jgi:hypothetical protein
MAFPGQRRFRGRTYLSLSTPKRRVMMGSECPHAIAVMFEELAVTKNDGRTSRSIEMYFRVNVLETEKIGAHA